jgi:transposase-like protein
MLDTFSMVKEISVMEQRYQAVLAVIRDGVPIVEVARRFDVSRQAVNRWLVWCRDEGFEVSKDRSHAPTAISDLI